MNKRWVNKTTVQFTQFDNLPAKEFGMCETFSFIEVVWTSKTNFQQLNDEELSTYSTIEYIAKKWGISHSFFCLMTPVYSTPDDGVPR